MTRPQDVRFLDGYVLIPVVPKVSPMKKFLILLFSFFALPASAQQPNYTSDQLLTEVQKRAVRFFYEQADPKTGLVADRARNDGAAHNDIASIASTGYALAALPIAAQHNWIPRKEAEKRAKLTLTYLLAKFPHKNGWFYHFVNAKTGAREWKSELSSIDTVLLVLGALTSGQYFKGNVQTLADKLYDRMDWQWMRTNGGTLPRKQTVSMGWNPEKGFIPNEWGEYCELMQLYLLGMGAKQNPLSLETWDTWERGRYTYGGIETITGGAIFMHQMAHLWYDFKNTRDRQGYDYWISSLNATHIQQQFVQDKYKGKSGYFAGLFGINASDGPKGYNAFGIPEPDDGTFSPTGAIASLIFDPKAATSAALKIYQQHGAKVWGKYGFANAFNPSQNWYDPDVIGIDLGMALLAIENHRTRLIWNLLASHPSTLHARKAAGLHTTQETGTRPLKLEHKSHSTNP